MSDLPPADQPQGTQARRATRSRSRSSAARRARSARSLAADSALSNEEATDAQAADLTGEFAEERSNDGPETLSLEYQADAVMNPKSRLTPLTKQILLWGAITAGIYIAFFIGLSLLSLAPTQVQQLGVITWPVTCLYYLIPYALPFIAGWRATAREGLGRHGGLAAVWSYVFSTVVILVVELAIAGFQGKLSGVNGGDLATSAGNFAIQALISFAFGWGGGSYSSWQRRRAQLKREQAETQAGD